MSTSTYFQKSWRAIIIAITLGVVLGAVGFYMGDRQPFVLGYAFGRVHQLADQRQQHSDPREPKGK